MDSARNAEGLTAAEAAFVAVYAGNAADAEASAGLPAGSGRRMLRRVAVKAALARRREAHMQAGRVVDGATKRALLEFWVDARGECTTPKEIWSAIEASELIAMATGQWTDGATGWLRETLRIRQVRRGGEVSGFSGGGGTYVDPDHVAGTEPEENLRFWVGVYRCGSWPWAARLRCSKNIARSIRILKPGKEKYGEILELLMQRFREDEEVSH